MKVVKPFLQDSKTYIGVGAALAFLVIFFCVWMTAYSGVQNRSEKLQIGFVNEDQHIGMRIENKLIKNIPFEVKTYPSIDAAKEDMNGRKLDMVIQIPNTFTNQLQGKKDTEIYYFINQANTSLAKDSMEKTAFILNQSVNKEVYELQKQWLASELYDRIGAMDSTEYVVESIPIILQSLDSQPVRTSVKKTNHTDGFAATMVPLMIVLVSFVGSMIISLNMNTVSKKLKNHSNKWSLFFGRQIINMGAVFLLSFMTVILLSVFNIELKTSLLSTWILQAVVYIAFLSLTQMFVVLFGPAGMLFNIICLSTQLATSGVIVPRAMLSNFYKAIGSILPATYVENGYYTVIYGGERLTADILALLLVAAVTLLVTFIKVALQKK